MYNKILLLIFINLRSDRIFRIEESALDDNYRDRKLLQMVKLYKNSNLYSIVYEVNFGKCLELFFFSQLPFTA